MIGVCESLFTQCSVRGFQRNPLRKYEYIRSSKGRESFSVSITLVIRMIVVLESGDSQFSAMYEAPIDVWE